jgi:uncharacterized protein (TIGR03032 family)
VEDQSNKPLEIRYEATASFLRVLEQAGCSLALSVYMSNRIVLLSARDGALQLHSSFFRRPMGLATKLVGGSLRLTVAGFQELVMLSDVPLLARAIPDEAHAFDHVFVPRLSLYCGDIDAHDLAWIGSEVFAANTRFSCISRIDAENSFVPVWAPPFISAIMPEDRCHLNGIAAAGDRISCVTGFGATDEARGWSSLRANGGVLIDVASGETVLGGLSMPHSPRIFDEELYVLESGTGRILIVDAAANMAQSLAELPGFVRGFDKHKDIFYVGMSRMRERAGVRLPVQEKHKTLLCGVAAVDRSGSVLGWLHFCETMDEIFDVKVLPGIQNAAILGVDDERHRRALSLPGRAFWGAAFEDADPAKKTQF